LHGLDRLPRFQPDGCPLTICPPLCCCPWGGSGPRFSSTKISRFTCNGTTRWSYSTTAAYLATRITGAPPLRRGSPPAVLAFNDVKTLQTLLARAGYDVGTVDGFSSSVGKGDAIARPLSARELDGEISLLPQHTRRHEHLVEPGLASMPAKSDQIIRRRRQHVGHAVDEVAPAVAVEVDGYW
jgi:hypothetical protein